MRMVYADTRGPALVRSAYPNNGQALTITRYKALKRFQAPSRPLRGADAVSGILARS
jgi:hypothetical protein